MKSRLALWAFTAFVLSCSIASAGMMDLFLKLEGIPGESNDLKHKGEIEITTFEHSMPRATSGGSSLAAPTGLRAERIIASPQPATNMVFVKRVDISSPKLAQRFATGEKIPTAVLVGRIAGQTQFEFMKLTLRNVAVTSYTLSGGVNDPAIATETVGVSFESIDWEYVPRQPNGTPGEPVKSTYSPK